MSAAANWISVGDLGQGFATDSNTLPPCHDFSGKSLELLFEDGSSWNANIDLDGNQQIINLPNGLRTNVRVTSLCEGVYFVDYITDNQAVSLVADMVSGRALQLQGKLPAREEASVVLQERAAAGLALTTVSVVFRNARIDGGGHGFGFPRTKELLGKHVRYRYSPTEVYEHLYLNETFYTWHCLKGVEAGLADTDLCHYFKLRDNLYLFVWQEKVVPTLGVVLLDLARGKTDGKIFGKADFVDGEFSNFKIGAFVEAINSSQSLMT